MAVSLISQVTRDLRALMSNLLSNNLSVFLVVSSRRVIMYTYSHSGETILSLYDYVFGHPSRFKTLWSAKLCLTSKIVILFEIQVVFFGVDDNF